MSFSPSKYFLTGLLLLVVLAACKKTSSYNAGVLLYNGSWSLPALSAQWSGNAIVSGSLAQGVVSGTADSPYVPVPAGTNLVTIIAGANTLLDKNIYTGTDTYNSFVVFDTSAVSSSPQVLQLTDDLSIPDTAQLKFRVLHLVPDTIKIDTWLVNGTSDSLRLDTAGAFIGKDAGAIASGLQTFTSTSFHGGSYSVKVKKSGTEQLYASLPAQSFLVQGIYTFVFSGLTNGSGAAALKVSVVRSSKF